MDETGHPTSARFPCPYLAGEVELTAERESHILWQHPELRVILGQRLRETLARPDAVFPSLVSSRGTRFERWYPVFPHKKWVVVVVISDVQDEQPRHWIVTAYVRSRRATGGSR